MEPGDRSRRVVSVTGGAFVIRRRHVPAAGCGSDGADPDFAVARAERGKSLAFLFAVVEELEVSVIDRSTVSPSGVFVRLGFGALPSSSPRWNRMGLRPKGGQ